MYGRSDSKNQQLAIERREQKFGTRIFLALEHKCLKLVHIKQKTVICKFCKKSYKNYGNTTNLISHMKNKHPVQYKDSSCECKPLAMRGFSSVLSLSLEGKKK